MKGGLVVESRIQQQITHLEWLADKGQQLSDQTILTSVLIALGEIVESIDLLRQEIHEFNRR